jgi:hypothetical protein
MQQSRTLARWQRLVGTVPALVWGAMRSAPAAACPACYESSSPNVLATYYLSTVMLTVLPFVIIGTLVAVGMHLARRLGESSAADAVTLTEPPPA